MNHRDELTAIWPLYGLAIRTTRLELRLPPEAEIPPFARVAAGGIQAPGAPRFQADWLYEPSPRRERALLQTVYSGVSNWDPDDWDLGLAVFHDGVAIGMRHIYSKHFSTTRGFGSSSWLGLPYQGCGFDTEMGRAILALGFDGLDGEEAYIGAWADNPASLRVMEKLGYVDNGQYVQSFERTARRDRRMRLPRAVWAGQPSADVEITGLAPCLELFGATGSTPPGGA